MHELHLRTERVSATRALAATLATRLRGGDVVALSGELGAGKTAFVQGAAEALGVTERVTSPTFLIRREYPGRVPVVHLDVYRLDSLDEVVGLGYEELFGPDFVTFVEWGDAIAPLLPPDHLEVELRLDVRDLAEPPVLDADGVPDEPRQVVLRAWGEDWSRRLGPLGQALAAWATAPAEG